MRMLIAGLCTLALAAAQAAPRQDARPSAYQPPALFDDGWKTASAGSTGRRRVPSSPTTAALTASMRAWPELGVHAILIERRGQLVYEEYFDGFDQRWGQPLGRVSMSRTSLHDVRSITKSVVSALVGIAAGAGAIRTLDAPVMEWFPEYADLNTPQRRRVTLAHMLSMTSGLEWN